MRLFTFNVLFFLGVLYVCFCIYTSSLVLFYGYAAIVLFYTLFDIRLGLMAYLIITPLANLSGNETLNLIYTSVFLLIYLYKCSREGIFQVDKLRIVLSYSAIILVAILSSLLTGYTEYIHVAFLFVLIFAVAVAITGIVIRKYENIILIANSFITAGIVAVMTSYLKVDGYTRLALGDSIRDLANILGLGLILLVLFYFSKQEIQDKAIESQYRMFKLCKWVILFILIVGLTSTISRGAILAVGGSLLFYLIITVFKNLYKVRIKWFLRFFMIAGLLVVGGLYFIDNIFNAVNFNTDILFKRFSGEHMEGGTGIRQEIWKAGISGLDGWEILYGHGYSSFRMLASKNGYDYYSHSPFVDTLVTTGIVGLLILLYLVYSAFKSAIKYKVLILGTLLIYLCLNYSTHGSMRSMSFWFILGLCLGISERYKEQKRLSNKNV